MNNSNEVSGICYEGKIKFKGRDGDVIAILSDAWSLNEDLPGHVEIIDKLLTQGRYFGRSDDYKILDTPDVLVNFQEAYMGWHENEYILIINLIIFENVNIDEWKRYAKDNAVDIAFTVNSYEKRQTVTIEIDKTGTIIQHQVNQYTDLDFMWHVADPLKGI